MNLSHVMELINQVSNVEVTMEGMENVELEENIVTIDGTEYIILDENDIQERMADHIRETASYFNYSFLASMTDLPEEVFEGLVDKNEAVYRLIEKTCGLDEFIEECLSVDGAGHFLNSYDGQEYELGNGYSAFNY